MARFEREPSEFVEKLVSLNRVSKTVKGGRVNKFSALMVVGDDDQSIYRFRGARPEIMLGFEKDFPGTKRVLLGTNYRSTKEIVETSLKLIGHNKKYDLRGTFYRTWRL